MKLQSDFAVLDVKLGRKLLRHSLKKNGPGSVSVIIHGTIEEEHGGDDGVSQEFGINVTRVEVPKPTSE